MRYLLMFMGGDASLKYSNLNKGDPRRQEEHFRKWNQWMANLVKDGKFEIGYPLTAESRKVGPSGIENDADPENSPGGFMVIRADSIEDAARIAHTSPIIENGGTVLVRECGEVRSSRSTTVPGTKV
jgi:hypothetical protein